MNTVLKTFLSMSFSGGLLILILLLGKRFLEEKISRQWQYYIWLVVILRLLLPFGPKANLMGKTYQAVDQAIAQTTPLPQQPPSPSKTPGGVFIPAIGIKPDNENENHPEEDLITARSFQDIATPLTEYIWLVWLFAALSLLIRKVTIYQGFIWYIKAGLTPVSDIERLDLLSIAAEQSGVKKPVELCINPLVSSPLLTGFFHPCIVLPSANIPQKEFQYTVLHELTHYKRRDMFYKWLVQITVCLHWFNPLVHLMSREIARACEFSCDEAVLVKIGSGNEQDYGKTLLNAMAAVGKYKENLGAVTLSENKQLLKERLGAIMNFKSKTKTIRVLTVILTLFILSGAVFIGGYSVSAATDSKGTSKSSIPEKKGNGKSTYIYDENLGYGWYLDDENLDNNDLENANSYQYSYTQNGYYCNSYIIEMGWNLYAKNQDYYGATEIVFEDESKMTVYFSDSVKDYLNDREAISAIEELIYSLKNTDISPAIEMPLIISITPVAADDIPVLTEQYFQNEDLIRFSALFSVLDETAQKDYYKKAYDADKIALFSTIIQNMDTNLVLQYVDKSEQDNKTNFFAVLSNYMPLSDLKRYIEKYYENNNIARFTILLDCMTKEEKQEWLKRAQTDRKTNFVAVLSNELLD
jgi:beta-lactamase regulating signal transducer with metallopeptidase domain